MLYKKLRLDYHIIYLGDFMSLTRTLSRKRIRWLANNLEKYSIYKMKFIYP